jgi:hypothetical protein
MGCSTSGPATVIYTPSICRSSENSDVANRRYRKFALFVRLGAIEACDVALLAYGDFLALASSTLARAFRDKWLSNRMRPLSMRHGAPTGAPQVGHCTVWEGSGIAPVYGVGPHVVVSGVETLSGRVPGASLNPSVGLSGIHEPLTSTKSESRSGQIVQLPTDTDDCF